MMIKTLRATLKHVFKPAYTVPEEIAQNTISTDDSGISVSLSTLLALRHGAESLKLNLRRKVSRQIAGGFTSGFRGRGVDFAEVRDYQAGDDIRHMDWRVTARTGKAHTKLYEEEKECPVFITVDYGPTMFFGSHVCFKSVVAAKTAALLAWAAVRNKDRVGGLIFSGTQHQEIRPQPGKLGILPLLKALADTSEPHQINTDPDALANTLSRLRHLTKPGSRIFLLSDFTGLNKTAKRHLYHLAQHNEVIAVFVYDTLETKLPAPNTYGITDGEQRLTINTHDKTLRKKYCEQFNQHYETIRSDFLKQKIPLLHIATQDDIAACLALGLHQGHTPLEIHHE